MKLAIRSLFLILIISFFNCEDELVEPVIGNAEDLIEVESELYSLIERVVTTEDNTEIGCIDFNYPFTIYTYDADLVFLNSTIVNGDADFSSLLAGLDPTYSISVSLPIVSTLSNGLSINITTNEELKEAIDNCIEEEFLTYCNETLPNCIWNVTALGGGLNTYDDAFFDVNSDGTVVFHYNNTTYNGTWINLMIENEVHLNINLENGTDVAADWNFDWLITLTAQGDFKIDNGQSMYLLQSDCEDICDLTFEACETEPDSGLANFDLESYIPCILDELNMENSASLIITFHVSTEDAEANVNPIQGLYTNVSNPQALTVRIFNTDTVVETYIVISLIAASC